MEEKKNLVGVNVHDLYQLLIEGNRYGYTRNNHLMPSGAFHHCRTYLPDMRKVDPEFALHTAKQLAEEAIDELRKDAYCDDKKMFSFFQDGIPGAEREIKAVWTKGLCCFAITYEFDAVPGIKFMSADGTVYAEIVAAGEGKVELKRLDFDNDPRVFHTAVLEPDLSQPGLYLSIPFWHQPTVIDAGAHLMFAAERRDERIDVKEYVDFVEFCLDFIKDSGIQPYNLDDYEEFIEKHPR